MPFFCLLGMISIYVISNNCNALRTVFFCSWYIYEISVQRLCKRLTDWCHNAFINWLILSVFVCVCKRAPCVKHTQNALISHENLLITLLAQFYERFARGGWIKWRQPCKSWLYVTYWGISTKVTTVWIVPSGSRCSILDFILAVVVTLGRCERCWSGALSRNSHRGSINLWCPADKRPTDRLGAVTLGNIPRVAF